MTLEELIYKGTNTSGISNVSTRGQPTTSTFCKKDIKVSIKSANGRYVKNVTNQILRNGDISGKLIKCVHRIAYSNYSNKEIINGTISWSSTSEGSDYWFGLYVNTKK